MIDETYTEFTMKHFEKICDRLKCSTDDLKDAIEVIRTLNPKPGEGSVSMINDNYLTPDFVIERDEEDFVIIPNDRHIPTLRINRAYQELMRRGKAKKNGDRSRYHGNSSARSSKLPSGLSPRSSSVARR